MQQLQQIWGQKDLHLHHIARTWQSSKTRVGWKSGKKLSRPLVYPRREGGGKVKEQQNFD